MPPGLCDVIWRPFPHHAVHLEIEPKVPFAAEAIGAALLGWHNWRTHDHNAGQRRGTAHDWVTSNCSCGVPTLGKWMPISITPLATSYGSSGSPRRRSSRFRASTDGK
jgi:hypothetical protein